MAANTEVTVPPRGWVASRNSNPLASRNQLAAQTAIAAVPAIEKGFVMAGDRTAIEEGTELLLNFGKLRKVADCGQSLVPAVAQDVETGEVLIIGYANREALDHAASKGVAAFWSTSRNELWVKGATSGDFLDVVEIRVNCEQNSLLYRVKLRGKGSCHTRDQDGLPRLGCFYRRIEDGKLVFVPDPRKAGNRQQRTTGG